MSFPKLTFPLTVDFSGSEYWIGTSGPFKYGETVTAFFVREDLGDIANDSIALMRELEGYLQTFGNYLHPYAKTGKVPDELFQQLEQSSAGCSINYWFHPQAGTITLVERYTFSTLRDFLYVELGKAILNGNGPRQCRLCGNWFLHEHGDKTVYCERIAPGEIGKTCREVGARAVFENKIQNEEAWKIYKRAYKKYYARVIKGNMSREDFDAWVEKAAAKRDTVILLLEATKEAEKRTSLIEELRENLNQD